MKLWLLVIHLSNEPRLSRACRTAGSKVSAAVRLISFVCLQICCATDHGWMPALIPLSQIGNHYQKPTSGICWFRWGLLPFSAQVISPLLFQPPEVIQPLPSQPDVLLW